MWRESLGAKSSAKRTSRKVVSGSKHDLLRPVDACFRITFELVHGFASVGRFHLRMQLGIHALRLLVEPAPGEGRADGAQGPQDQRRHRSPYGCCVKSNAPVRSPAFARTPGNGSSSKRRVISLMIDVVS